jgi:hypothetical protein
LFLFAQDQASVTSFLNGVSPLTFTDDLSNEYIILKNSESTINDPKI